MSTNFTGMMQITESECLKLRAGVRGGGGGGVGGSNSKKPRYFIRELRFK